jgi:hypothetical protein
LKEYNNCGFIQLSYLWRYLLSDEIGLILQADSSHPSTTFQAALLDGDKCSCDGHLIFYIFLKISPMYNRVARWTLGKYGKRFQKYGIYMAKALRKYGIYKASFIS